MTRNRASAKAAGTRFESAIADILNAHVDDRIERRASAGAKDRGDIGGLRHMGQRIVIECKDSARMELGTWAAEAELERNHDDAGVAVIAHKRHGKGDPMDQWITMTARDFISLLTGTRPQ